MIVRRSRLAFAGLLLGAMIGCDTNPGGPSAPSGPSSGTAPAPTEPGVMPAGKMPNGKPAVGVTPASS